MKNNDDCAKKFSEFLIERIKEKEYRSPTIRKIKAALVYYFNENGDDKLVSAVSEINYKPPAKVKPKPRTSAKKYKHLPDDEYNKLCLVINHSNGQYDKLILTWIESTLIVGLRPKEWIQTRLIKTTKNDKEFYILKVLNAKNTNDRSFGKYRHIVLEDLTEEEFFNIQSMMQYVESIREKTSTLKEAQIVWDDVYHSVRNRLYYLDKKARPKQKKSITLYSARHQFAADLKTNIQDEHERAALMGHASIITHNASYGRKHFGKKGRFRVRPLKDDVLKVHQLNPQSKLIQMQKKRDFILDKTNKHKPEQTHER